jgi:hypothetical protein
MAVLVEGISAIVRVQAIHDRCAGGWPAFDDNVPNNTLCSDNEVARVGFMMPADCEAFVGGLERHGLSALAFRRRNARFVEAALDHGVDFANQDVCRDLIFGAAEFSERRQQRKVIEGLDRERQAQRPRFRAVFRSRHGAERLTVKTSL